MNRDLVDLIMQLSANDKKTLVQKCLKGAEEIGELARVVLPFENAYATNHRFTTANAILEEVADNMLVVMSIAFDCGFTYDDITEMIGQKARKWAELQARESRYDVRGVPFEIHVTVRTTNIDGFRDACKVLDVKPIVLDLQDKEGLSVMTDVMTSSAFMGKNREAYNEMKRISQGLTDHGLQVVREKIESAPWHPAAPSSDHENPTMPKDCYFECHFGVLCTDARKPRLLEIAESYGAHLSRNVFKQIDDEHYKIMITHRVYDGTREEFMVTVDEITEVLGCNDFEVDKVITEFSVFDTKVSHDASWITS